MTEYKKIEIEGYKEKEQEERVINDLISTLNGLLGSSIKGLSFNHLPITQLKGLIHIAKGLIHEEAQYIRTKIQEEVTRMDCEILMDFNVSQTKIIEQEYSHPNQ